jgi:hypothetical protein
MELLPEINSVIINEKLLENSITLLDVKAENSIT